MRQDRGQSSPPDSAPRRSGPGGRLPPYIQASRACLSCPSSTPFTEPDRLTLIGPRKRVKPSEKGLRGHPHGSKAAIYARSCKRTSENNPSETVQKLPSTGQ